MTIAPTPASTAAASSSAAAATGTNALAKLSNNFNDFLSLLTTQLKHQDPSSPLDTSQFTSELVQFTGVEQQINTNASLTSLIQATQGSEVIQATSVVGKPLVVTSDHMALQGGAGSITYTAPSAGPVAVAVYNDAGLKLRDDSVTAKSGGNTWTWDGTENSGVKASDGAYKVVVTGAGANGSTSALPFTVNGTATGVTNTNGTVDVHLGALAVDFSKVVSVGASSAAGK